MKLPLSQAVSIAALLALASGCAGAPEGTASADESPTQTATEALTPAATPAITPTEFVADFGKPVAVAGTSSFACALGEVRLFAGPMPTTFAPADGRLLPISQNQALFTGLLTTFGGDGRTTFALPNLKAVTPNNLSYGVCVYGTFIGNR